jgi:hypothetical protein
MLFTNKRCRAVGGIVLFMSLWTVAWRVTRAVQEIISKPQDPNPSSSYPNPSSSMRTP